MKIGTIIKRKTMWYGVRATLAPFSNKITDIYAVIGNFC